MRLKDAFLTQSASDSSRKLQNLLQGPGVSLGETLTAANTAFYNHNQEKGGQGSGEGETD